MRSRETLRVPKHMILSKLLVYDINIVKYLNRGNRNGKKNNFPCLMGFTSARKNK